MPQLEESPAFAVHGTLDVSCSPGLLWGTAICVRGFLLLRDHILEDKGCLTHLCIPKRP